MRAVEHIHSARLAAAAEKRAMAEAAAALAPELERIAAKYGCAPATVARIAVEHTRSSTMRIGDIATVVQSGAQRFAFHPVIEGRAA